MHLSVCFLSDIILIPILHKPVHLWPSWIRQSTLLNEYNVSGINSRIFSFVGISASKMISVFNLISFKFGAVAIDASTGFTFKHPISNCFKLMQLICLEGCGRHSNWQRHPILQWWSYILIFTSCSASSYVHIVTSNLYTDIGWYNHFF